MYNHEAPYNFGKPYPQSSGVGGFYVPPVPPQLSSSPPPLMSSPMSHNQSAPGRYPPSMSPDMPQLPRSSSFDAYPPPPIMYASRPQSTSCSGYPTRAPYNSSTYSPPDSSTYSPPIPQPETVTPMSMPTHDMHVSPSPRNASPFSGIGSGRRIGLGPQSYFPGPDQAGQAPCEDAGGAPVYFGSAILDDGSVHPCKIAPHLGAQYACRVPYAGREIAHMGRYDLLPYDANAMELVRTSHGRVPPGCRPVEGGCESGGQKLCHAVARVEPGGVHVPGKAGEHLGGCHVAFGDREHVIRDNYEILCWRH